MLRVQVRRLQVVELFVEMVEIRLNAVEALFDLLELFVEVILLSFEG